jgi:hypothetical protein
MWWPFKTDQKLKKESEAVLKNWPTKKEGQLRDDLDKAILELAHMTECTLATVEWLESLAKPSKTELSRQRTIANNGINALLLLGYHTWGRKEGRVKARMAELGFEVEKNEDDRFRMGVRK